DTTAKRRRKLKLNEEAEQSEESVPNSPTPPENIEDQKDEEMQEGEEEEKGTHEIATLTAQDVETQVPNLEARVLKKPRSRRTRGEHIPPAMGYAEDA
ncbi:hypothetical protein KI387_044301, partial [Taxus chinensis]